jgi:dTDP-4-dehydrorhamnose 3,5-epimerase
MDEINIEGVILSPLKQIHKEKGSIFHALRKNESSFHDFGEAYFSHIDSNEIKAWKTHSKMWLNLIVPIGAVKFVMVDNRKSSNTFGNIFEVTLNPNSNYKRLTIPPNVTFGFKGVGQQTNLVLNIASIIHDPNEMENIEIQEINYNW